MQPGTFPTGHRQKIREVVIITAAFVAALFVLRQSARSPEYLSVVDRGILALVTPLQSRMARVARSIGRTVCCANRRGSAVAEILSETGSGAKLVRIGVQDEWGEVGTVDFLKERFRMRATDIAAAAKGLM